jgi:glycosyltransferase involved in cell wall biosynthesis
MRLVYIATDPITVFRLMDGQLGYMQRQGFDVTVIAAPGPLLERAAARERVRAIAVPMTRELSPARDAVALARLVAVLRRLRPTIVNAGTPKAGMLGVTAARLVGVPVVIYLLRGLRFEGARGAKRLLLCATEHVTSGLADRVLVNSHSLQNRFVSLGCVAREKTWVLGAGSSNGIEVERFAVSAERASWAAAQRLARGFPQDAFVVGFVGRFARDKGIEDLIAAFQMAVGREPRLRLLLVGGHDATDPLSQSAQRFIAEDARVWATGFVEEPAPFYASMDAFVFPSRREGFPNAPLEAAAAGLPVIAWRATGTVDAVVDQETGTLLRAGDVDGLARELVRYARDPQLGRAQGLAGRQRAETNFRRELVWHALADEYRRLASGANRAAL